ncbi:MAG TPA: ABC transporter permease [Longimicrobium sp.]
MDTLLQDIRYAARTLARSPGFTLAAVATLALGIGGTTAIFTAVRAVLLAPLPFARADELVVFTEDNPRAGLENVEVAPGNFAEWRARSRSVAEWAVYDYATANLSGAGDPERLRAFAVSANLFRVLGARAAVGRTFAAGEDRPGGARVVMLSHAFWRARFGADPRIVGRAVRLDGEPYTVVGVMPAEFRFPQASDVWLPLALDAADLQDRRGHWARVVGRLRPGASPGDAAAELGAIARQLATEHPETNAGWTVDVRPVRAGLLEGFNQMLISLMAASAFVLLIACANVAGLLLARGGARRRELAVRAALGAGRGRLVRQLLTESLLLALAGGGLGVLIATWASGALEAALPATYFDFVPQFRDARVNGAVLAFAGGVSLFTGVLFGLLPALSATGRHLQPALREGGPGVARGGGRARTRAALVVGEVALALVLLTAAGFSIATGVALARRNWGFQEERLLTMRVTLPQGDYPTDTAASLFHARLLERLQALPGVRAAGLATGVPMSGEGGPVTLEVEGRPPPPPGLAPRAEYRGVSPGYFAALGVPLAAGRAFGDRDRIGSPPVAVVSADFARRAFPGENPIGRRVRVEGDGNPWREIVGVAGDISDLRTATQGKAYIYTPFLQLGQPTAFLALRTAGDPAEVTAAVRRAVAALDPGLPVYDVLTMRERVAESMFPFRVVGWLLSALGAVALVLAAVGVYGVVAYGVAQRTHEIGVRMALGAARADVLRLFAGQGLRLALAGVALGAVGALAVARGMQHGMLAGVDPSAPRVFAAVAGVLAAAAVLASYLPARRAAGVDPMVALRAE